MRNITDLLIFTCLIGMLLFGFLDNAYAIRLHQPGSVWDLDVESNLRFSYNTVTNTGDLRSGGDDKLDYASYIYNIPIHLKYKSRSLFFINIRSEGPSHYAAPLKDISPTIEGARINKNGDAESLFYPGVSEVWLKFYLDPNTSLQTGQSPYIVGNGYALGGQYNNYGVTVSYEEVDRINVRLRYSILDYENRLYGIRHNTFQKWGFTRSDDSEAYMIATDVKFKFSNHTFQPYIGYFYDYTGQGERAQHGYFGNTTGVNFMAKSDRIYTVGLGANLEFPHITVELEGARNFGQTESDGSQGWGDIEHKGYLIHVAAKGHLGVFTPRIKMVAASGNKVDTGDPAQSAAGNLRRTENRAFAVFSPLNTNLVDSYAHNATVPVVAMAGGYSMNYGIRRPGTYNDPHVWENMLAYNIGLNFTPTDKTLIMLDYWKLNAMEAGIGQETAGGAYEYLSKDLGNEVDLYASYALTKSITVGVHGGYFWPGKYYKTVRADGAAVWNNNISQTARTDGSADSAYQMETFITFKF